MSVGQDIAVMRSNGRLFACGGMGGDIILKDFRTMKTEHTIDAHPGMNITSKDSFSIEMFMFLRSPCCGGQWFSISASRSRMLTCYGR